MKKIASIFMVLVLFGITSCTITPDSSSTGDTNPENPNPGNTNQPETVISTKDGVQSKVLDDANYTLTQEYPAVAAVNEEFVSSVKVKAKRDLADVVITYTIPDNAEYVKSESKAIKDGNKLTWNEPQLNEGQTKEYKVYLKPKNKGAVTACTTIKALPRQCVSTQVGAPSLKIVKTAEKDVYRKGDIVTFNITVTNTGNYLAKDVKISDRIDTGLELDGDSEISVGDLKPNESKTFSVKARATAAGESCNTAIAAANNVEKDSDDTSKACVRVIDPKLEVVKTTDDTARVTKKTATYNIVVKNTGDVDLKDVKVRDQYPHGTSFVSATNGGSHDANARIVEWTIPTLKANSEATYQVVLRGNKTGKLCNNVSVQDSEYNLRDNAEACTTWGGRPAILLEVIDTDDKDLGEEIEYTITATNQGNIDIKNIYFVAEFPAEVDPISVDGATAGEVQGKMVKVTKHPTLSDDGTISWTIKAKGVKAGDARVNVKMYADFLDKPVNEEESTQIY